MHHLRKVGVVVAVGFVIYAIGARATAQPKVGASATVKPFKPVQPLEEMMEGQNKLYKDIKGAMLDKNWADGSKLAWILGEIANANQYQRDDPRYQKFASQMSEQCVSLARALAKKDEAASKELASKIGATCGACHDAFKK